MNIVYINETCGSGSIGKLTYDLAEGLRQRGHSTCVFFAKENTSDFENAYRIGNAFGKNIHAVISRISGLQGYSSFFSTRRLLRQLDALKPDVVHLQNLHANYINLRLLFQYLMRKNIATVITLHDSWYYTGKCTYYVPAKCERWKASCGDCPLLHRDNVNPTFFFDRTEKCIRDKKVWFDGIGNLSVVGVSDWITGECKQSILQNKNVVTIKNWVDQDVFKPVKVEALRNRMRTAGIDVLDKFVVLMVSSRISQIKGYDVLIELAKKLPDDCQIIVIGRNKDDLPLPENIYHVPYTTSQSELAEYYSLADVCVNTTKYETFGMVTAEALSCGTPVIVYNNTASPELVHSGCGLVVDEEKGADGVVEAIGAIRHNGKAFYHEACISNAHQAFSKKKGIELHERLYHEMITGKKML